MSRTERTVSFIDLAGFTVATATHGDETAADLADRLTQLTADSLAHGDQLVKGMGDAVMLVSQTPIDALALAGRICRLADYEYAYPLLRIGVHHGPLVERSGDWFGTTVNIASRVAARARPGQVVTTAIVAAAGARSGMTVSELGDATLRGIADPIALFAVTACEETPDRAVDPVCLMAVARQHAAARRMVDGVEHLFCSAECATSFDRLSRNPAEE